MKSTDPIYLALPLATLFAGQAAPLQAQVAEHCSAAYYIDVTLPNASRWDMCWEHRPREGVVLHHIHYTPPAGERLQILGLAAVAQIHVPYNDNGARYHDVSDYGLGGQYMQRLSSDECPEGRLLSHAGRSLVCQQIEAADSGFAYEDDRLQGDALTLFSVSTIGAYSYLPRWRFLDDGSIEPAIGATGALQRFGGSASARQGWLLSDSRIGLSHVHNYFWRLDFDLGGTPEDDYAEELNFVHTATGRLERSVTRLDREAARSVAPTLLRRWRVVDQRLRNAKGLPISYEIRLPQSAQREVGPATEAFTHNDIYFTRYKPCEIIASHNPRTGACAGAVNEFVNNELLYGHDLVVWPSTSFYHVPRAEDVPYMDAHWSYISLMPRDLNDRNPLSNSPDFFTDDGSNDSDGDSDDDNGGSDDNGKNDADSGSGSTGNSGNYVFGRRDTGGGGSSDSWVLIALLSLIALSRLRIKR